MVFNKCLMLRKLNLIFCESLNHSEIVLVLINLRDWYLLCVSIYSSITTIDNLLAGAPRDGCSNPTCEIHHLCYLFIWTSFEHITQLLNRYLLRKKSKNNYPNQKSYIIPHGNKQLHEILRFFCCTYLIHVKYPKLKSIQ